MVMSRDTPPEDALPGGLYEGAVLHVQISGIIFV
jgi:hypothetical protein